MYWSHLFEQQKLSFSISQLKWKEQFSIFFAVS